MKWWGKNKDEEVKELLITLKDCDVCDDYQQIVDTYVRIINLQPDRKEYWEELLDFIYFNYKYTDSYDWDVCLEKGISIAEKAINHIESKESQSNFYMYQYELIMELLNHDSFYFEKYNEEYLLNLLDKAIVANPQNIMAIQEKGIMLNREENYVQADEKYQEAYNLIQDNPILSDSILFDSAINLELMKDVDKTIATYEKILLTTKSEVIREVSIQSLIRLFEEKKDEEKVLYYKKLYNELS